ncbi:restriction endonuclease subunit S [Paracoccus panacisoli]|uniref:Restriction endonuclease subunit S n=1 Tax=Paracoccus panacisoli TaxID=1510163 RepID=A0ABV6T6D0_9RHOB
MSDLPDAWSVAEGDALFHSVRGVTYNKSDASSVWADGLVPVLRANNIADGKIRADDLVYVPSSYVSPNQYLRSGDLLIATSSGSRTVVGKAATASTEHSQYAFGAFCTVARPRVEDLGPWLSLFSRTPAYRNYVERVALGISINNLRGSDLKSMPIDVPPLPEQRRIVAKIDSLSGKSRRARDHLDHIPRLIEKYKQAVLAAAFRGDLTREWRMNCDPISPDDTLTEVAAARSSLVVAKTRSRFFKDVAAAGSRVAVDLGSLPSSWAWTTLENITDPTRVIQYGILKPGPHVEDGIPYVKVMNIRNERIHLSTIRKTSAAIHEQYRRSTIRKGDILLTIRGTVGRIAAVPPDLDNGNITQDSVRIAVLPAVNTKYIFWYLLSPFAQAYFLANQKGVAVRGINVGDVRPMEVPLPSRAEQDELVRRIEAAFTWIDRLSVDTTRARQLIGHLDQAVLANAFRGELVPQDPDDEPASVLLQRIKAERAAAPKTKRGRKASVG